MSANRDRNQRVTFLYSNLYQIYKKGTETAQNASDAPGLTHTVPHGGKTSAVIKAGDRRTVENFQPMSLLALKPAAAPERVPAPADPAPVDAAQQDAIQNLKANLQALNDLHARLRFMLKELEELVKE